jgi:hypothetical protein
MTQASAALFVSQVGTQRGAAAVGGAIYMLNGLVKGNMYRKPCIFFPPIIGVPVGFPFHQSNDMRKTQQSYSDVE